MAEYQTSCSKASTSTAVPKMCPAHSVMELTVFTASGGRAVFVKKEVLRPKHGVEQRRLERSSADSP